MKLINVEMEIPKIVLETEEKVKNLVRELSDLSGEKVPFVIAGGCLSNPYMKRKISDVDVFIEYFNEDGAPDISIFESVFETTVTPVLFTVESAYEFIQHPMLYRLELNGVKVELVFCKDINRIYDFDLRFRQFYLLDGKVKSTKEALNDIKEKKIVLASPCSPLSTFIRMKHFEREIGFSIEKESEEFLLYFINKKRYYADSMLSFIQNKEKLNEEARAWLIKWIKDHTVTETPHEEFTANYLVINETSTSFDKNVLKKLENHIVYQNGIERNVSADTFGVWREILDKARTFKETDFSLPEKINIEFSHFQAPFEEILSLFKTYLKKNRIKVITESKEIKSWNYDLKASVTAINSTEYLFFYTKLLKSLSTFSSKDLFELFTFPPAQYKSMMTEKEKWEFFIPLLIAECNQHAHEMYISNTFWSDICGELEISPVLDFDVENLNTFLDGKTTFFSLIKNFDNGNRRHLGKYMFTKEEHGIKIEPYQTQIFDGEVLTPILEKLLIKEIVY